MLEFANLSANLQLRRFPPNALAGRAYKHSEGAPIRCDRCVSQEFSIASPQTRPVVVKSPLSPLTNVML